MAIEGAAMPKVIILDKDDLRRRMDELNARMGIVRDPTATAEKAIAMQRARGIRAEDNGATRELLRMRYGDHYDEDQE